MNENQLKKIQQVMQKKKTYEDFIDSVKDPLLSLSLKMVDRAGNSKGFMTGYLTKQCLETIRTLIRADLETRHKELKKKVDDIVVPDWAEGEENE